MGVPVLQVPVQVSDQVPISVVDPVLPDQIADIQIQQLPIIIPNNNNKINNENETKVKSQVLQDPIPIHIPDQVPVPPPVQVSDRVPLVQVLVSDKVPVPPVQVSDQVPLVQVLVSDQVPVPVPVQFLDKNTIEDGDCTKEDKGGIDVVKYKNVEIGKDNIIIEDDKCTTKEIQNIDQSKGREEDKMMIDNIIVDDNCTTKEV